jgi:hypothetical protein
MPSFTHTLQSLKQQGPLVEVLFLPSDAFLKHNSVDPIPTVSLMGMVDTGASTTVIQRGFAERLGLSPIGVTHITTPSSMHVPCMQYDMAVSFPNSIKIGSIVVTEAPLQGQHIQCLIGHDILAHGVLIYIGYTNTYTLSF